MDHAVAHWVYPMYSLQNTIQNTNVIPLVNLPVGSPTKRQVSKCLVSERPVSKCQVYKTSGFKTSELQNVRFTKCQVSKRKRPVFKFDIFIKQKV
jgi:hypothetical protein